MEQNQLTTTAEKQAVIVSSGDDLTVIASDPQELVEAQHTLIASVARKMELAQADVKEAESIIAAANMAKIDDSAGKLLLKRSKSRLLYLSKVKETLEAGYVIMPSIGGDSIVIAWFIDTKAI